MYSSSIDGSTSQAGPDNEWAPFASRLDWEVARWAKLRGSGSTAFSDLLAIPGICEALDLSYKNSKELDSIIDRKLPGRRPAFKQQEIHIAGESFDMFSRNILDCIRALYGDPQHAQYLCITPERHYADANKTQRLYHDMYTGRWWWSTQKALESRNPGATIIPIILSSDKTQITLFRNKTAYPVYLTIGNLPKTIRRKPSLQGQILLAYLPTTRLMQVSNKAARRRMLANLFHACMSRLVLPLKDAGVDGIVMSSGDGIKRRCHPILAAFVGDYPEQCLVTAAYTGDCPVCDCPHKELGEYPCEYQYRDLDNILDALNKLGSDRFNKACFEANIKPIQHPFWQDLPFLDIYRSITPDILHQVYQGVIKHLLAWLKSICGAAEIDARVRRLPPNHHIRIFHKGVTTLSRVSGAEHGQMCSFLLGVITDIRIPGHPIAASQTLLRASRALLDFLYLAQYPVHSDTTISALSDALDDFHSDKHVFVDVGVRGDFNLPKLHFLQHYIRAIKLFGTTDNYNTEATERLHIDFTKAAYRATNRRDEFPQMTRWLERREKVLHHANFITWCQQQRKTVSSAGNLPRHQAHLWKPPDMACALHIKMTRHPSVRTVPLDMIVSPSHYGAEFFIPALARFVVQYSDSSLSSRRIEDKAADIVLPFRTVPVFHRIKFWNEEIHGNTTLDSIHIQPPRLDAQGNISVPARFDTALVQIQNIDGQVAGTSAVQGTRIGQIRVVFSIPDRAINHLFPNNLRPPRHLAYVEWFSRFTTSPEPHIKMYKVKRSIKDGEQLASVIPLALVKRSVHLLPKWGPAVPDHWSSDNVLDECTVFYLNCFKDPHTYFNVW